MNGFKFLLLIFFFTLIFTIAVDAKPNKNIKKNKKSKKTGLDSDDPDEKRAAVEELKRKLQESMDKTAKETGTKPFKLEAYTPDDIGKLSKKMEDEEKAKEEERLEEESDKKDDSYIPTKKSKRRKSKKSKN